MTLGTAAKEIIMTALNVAREEAAKQELELGRRLTEGEARRLAEMVERQLRIALALAKG